MTSGISAGITNSAPCVKKARRSFYCEQLALRPPLSRVFHIEAKKCGGKFAASAFQMKGKGPVPGAKRVRGLKFLLIEGGRTEFMLKNGRAGRERAELADIGRCFQARRASKKREAGRRRRKNVRSKGKEPSGKNCSGRRRMAGLTSTPPAGIRGKSIQRPKTALTKHDGPGLNAGAAFLMPVLSGIAVELP